LAVEFSSLVGGVFYLSDLRILSFLAKVVWHHPWTVALFPVAGEKPG